MNQRKPAGARRRLLWFRHLLVLVSLTCTGAFVFCQPRPQSTLERVRREGFLRAAYTQEPPYSFFDESSGQVKGESPEALLAAADEIGVEIRWVRLDFDELVPALLTGRVDVVAAGMFSTPQRQKQVSFSMATVCSKAALVVQARSPLTSIQDIISDSSYTLAVLNESVEQSAAAELGVRGGQLVTVPDLLTGVVAVKEGAASGFAITLPSARRAVQDPAAESLEIRRYTPPPQVQAPLAGCSALAFRPKDVDLISSVNAALDAYVGSDRHLANLQLLGFSREDIPQVENYR